MKHILITITAVLLVGCVESQQQPKAQSAEPVAEVPVQKLKNPEGVVAEPPFTGTIFIDPDIIKPSDPSSYVGMTESGQDYRKMYDRRVNNWVNRKAYLFNAAFNDQLKIEIQVNPEFGSVTAAKKEAEKYSEVIGQLTTSLRKDVQTVWIHKGVKPFGGGNNNLLIHTGQAVKYIKEGILEETFYHEAAHTSMDAYYANTSKWRMAQKSDNQFISTYAKDNPTREDIAESYLPYFAVRYRSDRISKSLVRKITQSIPNRIKYFDSLSLDMYPVVNKETADLIRKHGGKTKKELEAAGK